MVTSTQKNVKKETVRITATLSSDQYELLTSMAKKSKVSVAWCIRRAVEKLIEEREGSMLPFERDAKRY
ncbi:MAG: ribbon-helix-helix domain-containing protein [Nitrospiraceae bacterium]|nr:ribbon-helix-helix domain-containing protein [Nitrospiraceae bacterium]